MKKILLILALVCMMLATASGVAYAVTNHQVVRGNKLVGTGQFGVVGFNEGPGARVVVSTPTFTITNTDCRETVTIKQLSILDSMGDVVYEGPLYRVIPTLMEYPEFFVDWATPIYTVVGSIGPHETISIPLMYMFPDPDVPSEWLDWPGVVQQIAQAYTVEVFWTSAKGGPTLTGTVAITSQHLAYDAGGIMVEREVTTYETAMVNR